MKLSVLSVAYPFAPVGRDAVGGAEQVLSTLDSALVAGGHRSVVVACEGSLTEGELVATPRECGTLDDTARQRGHEAHRRAIRMAIATHDFDLIHMHGVDFYEYLPPPGPTVLVTLHLPLDYYPPWIFHVERPFTRLHCVSAAQQRSLPPCAMLLPAIENGVRVEELEIRTGKGHFVAALGRICPEKGFHLAIEAARAAGVPLVLAGEVFPYEAHQRYFRNDIQPNLGRGCRFIGRVGLERKRRLLAAARCLLAPSLVPETSSLVAMEALACGTPVVAFRAGALADIVEHGRTGFLVENANEMAEAIPAADRLDPEDCRRAARERFSASRMAAEYLNLYRALSEVSGDDCLSPTEAAGLEHHSAR